MPREFVSILMLTFNAPDYVELSVRSVVEKTKDVEYELIVVDNASDKPTRELVSRLHAEGSITQLLLSEKNTLFSGGNNLAATLASDRATHFLLLNSDIEVKDSRWLRNLLDHHKRGITSYGIVPDVLPGLDMVDGYCLLVDADLYREAGGLDETHQWWWAVTKLQARLLNGGHAVRGFEEHEAYLHHFGGKSGSGFKGAKGMDVTLADVERWFNGHRPVVLDLGVVTRPVRAPAEKPTFARRVVRKLKKVLAGA